MLSSGISTDAGLASCSTFLLTFCRVLNGLLHCIFSIENRSWFFLTACKYVTGACNFVWQNDRRYFFSQRRRRRHAARVSELNSNAAVSLP